MTGDRGDQGTTGPRGAPGERGAQGSSGPSGGQGIEGPAGESAQGEQGVQGERGQRGRRAPLRWAPLVGYLLLIVFGLFLLYRVTNVCADTRASFALRNQWARVEQLINDQAAGKLKPQEAGKQFAESYRTALREAGPAPDCRGWLP